MCESFIRFFYVVPLSIWFDILAHYLDKKCICEWGEWHPPLPGWHVCASNACLGERIGDAFLSCYFVIRQRAEFDTAGAQFLVQAQTLLMYISASKVIRYLLKM